MAHLPGPEVTTDQDLARVDPVVKHTHAIYISTNYAGLIAM